MSFKVTTLDEHISVLAPGNVAFSLEYTPLLFKGEPQTLIMKHLE